MDILTFYAQAIGSSHIVSNKPCQDNGIHHYEDGVAIAIVCDGHGGESYVRSDTGSKLAAQIAKEEILRFISQVPKELFLGKKGQNTAAPLVDPRLDKNGNKRDQSLLSESEMDLLKQAIRYTNESQRYPDIEEAFRQLFSRIYNSWINAITKDSTENAFSKKENEKLGSRRIQKAYGSTLMAVVRTMDYWFAFQIGDGKLYSCDKLMRWIEPVPWDCNCFLNVTTSLCDSSPSSEFRYAFDGTGEFPVAFALGSDGIDDTFLRPELIHKFYSRLLCVFSEQDTTEAVELLEKHLSELSKRGSHDDMSIAAIIDKAALPKAIEYYKIISEVRALNAEKTKREMEISRNQDRIESLRLEIADSASERDDFAKEMRRCRREMLQCYCAKKEKYANYSNSTQELMARLDKLKSETGLLIENFDEWKTSNKIRIAELKKLADSLEKEIYPTEVIALDNHDPSCADNPTDKPSNTEGVSDDIENCDSPNEVQKKAIEAVMSEEGIAKMDRESDAQVKELLNKIQHPE